MLFVLGDDLKAEYATRAFEALADKTERAKIASSGDRALDKELEAALANPRVQVRVNELAARVRADAEMRRAALLLPQRYMVEQFQNSQPLNEARQLHTPVVREVVLWAGERDRSHGRNHSPFGSLASAVYSVFFGIAFATVFFAAVFRGGLSLMLAGIKIVRADGRRAARWQCSVRAARVAADDGTAVRLGGVPTLRTTNGVPRGRIVPRGGRGSCRCTW